MCNCFHSHAEQLVLYLKTAELLSNALHTAMEQVKQGKLYPSATVKQGIILLILPAAVYLRYFSCILAKNRSVCFLSLHSREKTERAVQVQCDIVPRT